MFPVDLNFWNYVQVFPWYPWGIGYRVCSRIPNPMDAQDLYVKCHSIWPTPMFFKLSSDYLCLQCKYLYLTHFRDYRQESLYMFNTDANYSHLIPICSWLELWIWNSWPQRIYCVSTWNQSPSASSGTREKVRSKRINLEGNTHAQEINVSQLPV
jgi:hypothetical protein